VEDDNEEFGMVWYGLCTNWYDLVYNWYDLVLLFYHFTAPPSVVYSIWLSSDLLGNIGVLTYATLKPPGLP